jgi:hypothetical protein
MAAKSSEAKNAFFCFLQDNYLGIVHIKEEEGEPK